GDEVGRTQRGNNNAYCQDSELTWVDWEPGAEQRQLLDFTRRLIALRRAHPVLRRRRFFRGSQASGGAPADLTWLRPDGREMTRQDWSRADAHAIAVHLNGDAIGERDTQGRPVRDDSFLVLLNSHWEHVVFTLPGPVFGGRWRVEVDTAADPAVDPATGLALDRAPDPATGLAPVAGTAAGVYGPGETVKAEARSLVLLIREDGLHREAGERRESGSSRQDARPGPSQEGGRRAGGTR
ncbi:MAG: hypothetical protein FWE15_21480, partial [Actinomycetia bacterium]|nr:hypothetical protein [Actinomycetes bacterium]